ncbi:NUDIX hydrolase [Paenibacillus xylaniclasticus]|uniref:NUDIX hydrolase n=1 Tax=Paenibacillus xylaniclasticus TaxID=588083 RepID=UPI000FDBE8FA|nr:MULTISPECIES: NUDIX hydrolase [Paenibacillus]GFN29957.1 Nudix hydrolase [Paenibacillus curdlanolyticus]
MTNGDITLNVLDGKFSYRVGAIIMDSDQILLAKDKATSFYYTIGGRARFGETAEEAIVREMFEETGLRLEAGELKYVHENFFTSVEGTDYHELCFYFTVQPSSELRQMKQAFFEEPYGEVPLHWIPIHELSALDVYPEFFKTEDLNSNSQFKRFITRNGRTYPASDHESQ